MTGDEAALSPDRLSAALRPWLPAGSVAVGVSGGADSMVLLWALSQLIPAGRIVALTVDHGLRAEARDEAAMVAGWCRDRGITHRILPWDGTRPATGIQAAARAARYHLLAAACEAEAADTLFIAHHADDQAETVFARLARGAGLDGLSAMPERRLIAAGAGAGVNLVRPFLGFRRDALRATAEAHEVPFIDDRSNDDPAYERVRRRAFLAAAGVQEFLSVPALADTAAALAREGAALETVLAEDFAHAGGWFSGTGAIALEARRVMELPPERRARLLARAIEAAGGSDMPVPVSRLPDGGGDRPVTLAGALIQPDSGRLWVMREPAALTGRADGSSPEAARPAEAGKRMLWDRRFIVDIPDFSSDLMDGLSVAPIGKPDAGPVTNRGLISTMPGLWNNRRLESVPPYAKTMLAHAAAPWNTAAGDLHVVVLTEERFFRRIIRFGYPA